jgi:hypothetical protein
MKRMHASFARNLLDSCYRKLFSLDKGLLMGATLPSVARNDKKGIARQSLKGEGKTLPFINHGASDIIPTSMIGGNFNGQKRSL